MVSLLTSARSSAKPRSSNQELHLVQLDLHGTLQVQQAARRGDHQVGVLQLGDLQLVRHAAHHARDSQAAAMLHQVDGVVRHLLREFARGAQDQRAGRGGLEVARTGRVLALGALGRRLTAGQGFGDFALELGAKAGFGCRLLLEQRVQHGQQEGRGLAAAGLAGNHQVDVGLGLVVGGQRQGNGLFLHGGGLGIAQVGHGADQLGRKAQFQEAVGDGGNERLRGFNGGFGGDCQGIDGFGRRKVALHCKSVGHK
jgi:hypothetical protein